MRTLVLPVCLALAAIASGCAKPPDLQTTEKKEADEQKQADKAETTKEAPIVWLKLGQSHMVGDVEITLVEARIGRLAGGADEATSFTILVRNASETRKIDFVGWGDSLAKLKDEFGNNYQGFDASKFPGVSFAILNLYPEKSEKCTVAFERPVAKAKTLSLELSRNVIDRRDSGYIGFTIPIGEFKSD
ncbi:hypothetical protein [Zavarzinella formosa]|uniref:hypothetical protein n=1 Tax=Zavarzinella formosa TaxID=360055 RepID=UPI0002EC026E|nr:hypothetical protein [Zavarzinella formosa]